MRKGFAFSLTHAIFFVAFHIHLTLMLPPAATFMWNAVKEAVGDSQRLVMPIASLGYFATLIPLHLFAQSALALASMPNFFPHLLFPLHVFDFTFYYLFFAVRTYTTFNAAWLPSVLLLQGNIFMKNTGTYEAFGSIFRQRVLGIKPASHDAIIHLQFLARLSLLYDLGDFCAMLTVPTMISYFVWRDGVYAIDGVDFELRRCDLGHIWLHFALLLIAKQPTLWLVRKVLERKMARMVAGKSTIHGRSLIATKFSEAKNRARRFETTFKQRTMRRLPTRGRVWDADVQGIVTTRASAAPASRESAGDMLTDIVISQVADADSNRKEVLKREWEVNNFNFDVLRYKTIRRSWAFFAAVVLFELFSVLQLHSSAPLLSMTGNCGADLDDSADHHVVVVMPPWMAWARLESNATSISASC